MVSLLRTIKNCISRVFGHKTYEQFSKVRNVPPHTIILEQWLNRGTILFVPQRRNKTLKTSSVRLCPSYVHLVPIVTHMPAFAFKVESRNQFSKFQFYDISWFHRTIQNTAYCILARNKDTNNSEISHNLFVSQLCPANMNRMILFK